MTTVAYLTAAQRARIEFLDSMARSVIDDAGFDVDARMMPTHSIEYAAAFQAAVSDWAEATADIENIHAERAEFYRLIVALAAAAGMTVIL